MSTVAGPRRVHIGRVVRNAVIFNFRNKPTAEMDGDSLLDAVERLFALLHSRKIEYVLVGGIALLQYVEGRNTEDLDLIMALQSLQRVAEIEIVSQDANFARGKFGGLQVDILLTRNPLFEHVRRNHVSVKPFAERDIPCATVEGLLLLKLYALPPLYREGKFARVGICENDIATLMHDYQPQIEPLLSELAGYVSETDMAAVRDILEEIQIRIRRFGKANNTGD
jgi:hypothetical protein